MYGLLEHLLPSGPTSLPPGRILRSRILRTITARAIRSRFFEAHYGLIADFLSVSGADEIAARIASARQRRSPISMSGRRGGVVVEEAHSFNDYVQRRQREDIAGRAANP